MIKKSGMWIAAAVSFIGIIAWQLFFGKLNYYIVSVSILALLMLPFFASFERGKSSAREISLVATMIALAVVSRAAFYLIPQVKPIAAVVIVSAVCLGAEKGCFIGAFSAFVSNFLFGQGYWTPFQMAALGAVGLFAGVVFKAVKANKWSISIVGFILAFAVYGLIVDVSTILAAYGNNVTVAGIISVYSAGAPFSLAFGASTAVFLFLFGEPFIRKLNRIITKYEIISNGCTD